MTLEQIFDSPIKKNEVKTENNTLFVFMGKLFEKFHLFQKETAQNSSDNDVNNNSRHILSSRHEELNQQNNDPQSLRKRQFSPSFKFNGNRKNDDLEMTDLVEHAGNKPDTTHLKKD